MSSEVGHGSSSEMTQVMVDPVTGSNQSEMGLSELQDLGGKIEDFRQEIMGEESSKGGFQGGFDNEGNNLCSSSSLDVSNDSDGKDVDGETLLEEKKKKLLEELEVGLLPGLREVASTVRIKDGEKLAGDGGGDSSITCPLKGEVVDDTALSEILPLSEAWNSSRTETKDVSLVEGTGRNDKRNGKEKAENSCKICSEYTNTEKDSKRNLKNETDGKKTRRSRRKGNGGKMISEVKDRQENDSWIAEPQRPNDGLRRMYSRREMEALRYISIVEQQKIWNRVYNDLGPVVSQEYDEIASVKHKKNLNTNFNPQQGIKKNGVPSAVFGELCSKYVDNEKAAPISVSSDDGCMALEEVANEDSDSDDDCDSIQRPAFVVDGEPNFECESPEDGLEYLRRVRWEAAQIPKVKIAKVDSGKFSKQQTIYMPQIPDIAKCPDHLVPLKQWEDAFLADFSELRQYLSCLNDSIMSSHNETAMFVTQRREQLSQPLKTTRDEKFGSLKVSEAKQPLGDLILDKSINNQPSEGPTPNMLVSGLSCNPPTLSAILAMDAMTRNSALRKRIIDAETRDGLSKNDCLWLFALCAGVDTPLDPDTSASLRSLLRKCASLRAQRTDMDDQVVMLNILATIAGRYFGQSER